MTQSGTVTASIPAGAVTDLANNPNVASTSTDNKVTYNAPVVDRTPPVIEPTVTGTLGDNGWYTSDVSVSWTVTDDESTISNQTGCGAQSVTSDTAGVTFTCSATSAGGTAEKSVTIKRDATAPILAPAVNPNPVLLSGSATATPNATDATSGVASQSCAAVVTSSVGSKSVSCTATDNAGNSATATVTYKVVYNFKGFFLIKNPPTLNKVKAGAVIPFSFTLGGNYGRNVVTSATSVPISCTTLAPLSQAGVRELVQADTGLNATTSSRNPIYVYLWFTSRSYKNSCRQFTLTLNDTTEHTANFRFY